jgi:HSP20 family protein
MKERPAMALPVRRRRNADVPRWDPASDVDRLRSQIDALFDRVGDVSDPLAGLLDVFVPLADVEETDDAYIVEIELPGVERDDVDVSVNGRRLLVTGERKERERAGLIRRRTRKVGEFRYELILPDDLDPDGVQANLDRGVLTVQVAKAAADRRRRIEVG